MATLVRLQAADGVWETVGADRLAGIRPEAVAPSSNDHGYDVATFSLRRDPGAAHPDLEAYTPCEIEIGGEVRWEGRVRETPSKEGSDAVINVTGQGWQYHEDDDLYQRTYVHSRIADYVDVRTKLAADLVIHFAAGQVSTDEAGALSLAVAKDTIIPAADRRVGVVLDLGALNLGKPRRIVFDWETSNNSGSWFLYCRAGDAEDSTKLSSTQEVNFAINSAASGITALTVTNDYRYVHFFIYTGTAQTLAADVFAKLKSIRVFTSAVYEAGNGSRLRASDVVSDAIATTCPLLSAPVVSSAFYSDEVKAVGSIAVGSSVASRLAAQYRLNERAGTTCLDDSSNGRTGTYQGGVTLQGPNYLAPHNGENFSAVFDGVDDAAKLPLQSVKTSDWTMEAVCSIPSNIAGRMIYTNGDVTGSFGYGFGIGQSVTLPNNAGNRLLYLAGGVEWKDLGANLTLGNIYHIVVSRDSGGNLRCWVNGALVLGATASTTPQVPGGNAWIGSNYGTAGQFTPCTVDEAAFYDRAITAQQEVDELYKAALAPTGGTIRRSGFAIPDFSPAASRTPREVSDAADIYHGWRKRVVSGRNVEYGPFPANPVYEVGQWSGAEFEDLSKNSAEDIFNRVIVEASGPDGTPLQVERTSASLESSYVNIGVPTLPNPSFDVDVSGWTPVAGSGGPVPTIVRDTALFDTSPASGKFTWGGGAGDRMESAFSGTFQKGKTYRITCRARWPTTLGGPAQSDEFRISSSVKPTPAVILNGHPFAQWVLITIIWTPAVDVSDAVFMYRIWNTDGVNNYVRIDSISVSLVSATLIDRRGFRRSFALQSPAAMVQVVAERVGDVWLANHRTTPFKGSLRAQVGGVRDHLSGKSIHPSELLNASGEMIRFVDHVDPDTGGVGRDGRISAVAYDDTTETATVSLDDQRDNIEKLLQRLAVVQGLGSAA